MIKKAAIALLALTVQTWAQEFPLEAPPVDPGPEVTWPEGPSDSAKAELSAIEKAIGAKQDGHKWLAAQKAAALARGNTWANEQGGLPWLDLEVPPEGLILHSPLVLPLRSSLIGPRSYLRTTPLLIYVSDKFPEGETAISWEDARGQGHFSQVVRNISIDCRNIANGIEISGDQESDYDGILIWEPKEWGVYAPSLSHGTCIERLSVEGERWQVPTITGLRIGSKEDSVTGALIQGASFNWCKVGIDRFNCHTVDDVATSFEHVTLPWRTTKSNSCRSRGHALLSGSPYWSKEDPPEEGTLALVEKSQRIEISGTSRKCPEKIYVERDGKRHLTSGRGNRNNPQPHRFSK